MYYVSIYILNYPELIIGFVYLSNITESMFVTAFTYIHNRILDKVNYNNIRTILPYESDDENYEYSTIEEEIINN